MAVLLAVSPPLPVLSGIVGRGQVGDQLALAGRVEVGHEGDHHQPADRLLRRSRAWAMKPSPARPTVARRDQPPALDPAVIKLVDALARGQAKEDHQQESCPNKQTSPAP
jgi:hypothetical protein